MWLGNIGICLNNLAKFAQSFLGLASLTQLHGLFVKSLDLHFCQGLHGGGSLFGQVFIVLRRWAKVVEFAVTKLRNPGTRGKRPK